MKRLALVGLAALAVTACAPPFLADLNKAAALTGHMTMVGTVGAVSLGSASNVRFYPVKQAASSLSGLNIQSGFIVSDSGSSNENLQFVFTDSNGTQTTGANIALPVSPSQYPVYDYDVTTPTASGTATILVVSATNNSYDALTVTVPNGPFTNPAALTLTSVFTGIGVLGGQMVPQQGTESFNFLLSTGTSYANGPATLTGSTLTSGGNTTYATLPGSPTRATYGVSGGIGYASYYNGTGWVCYELTTAPPSATLLPGVTNRIDTVLTSGDLLSTQDGTLRLYDSSGSQIYAVPLNGLQYCYEMYVGGTPYVFFSLPITVPHNNMAFNTYAIPTSSMPNLGK